MAADLKSFFSTARVRRLAGDVARVYPEFPEGEFIRRATRGLARLELLDRGRQIAAALAGCLPPEFPRAIDILLESLGPEHVTDELIGAGMEPFHYLPHTMFVAQRGLGHFTESMRAQAELTKRFSAEASIRPFIERYPARTLRQLQRWSTDRNAHVRRLVSEGTRLRLPWAPRVRWLDENPLQVVALLERLRDDPSTMVRRSVANNLNDLGKVWPQLLADTCEAWLADATAERRALVEHALRSAVKRGDPNALRLLGFGDRAPIVLDRVRFTPARVRIGGRVAMRLTLRNTGRKATAALVDVAVHFVKARGRTGRKVFKLSRLNIAPGGRAEIGTTFSLALHSTRTPHPGRHVVELLVNGVAIPAGGFDVARAAPKTKERKAPARRAR